MLFSQFIEIMDTLDAAALKKADEKKGWIPNIFGGGGSADPTVNAEALHAEARVCRKILTLMNNSALLLDEVRHLGT